MEEAEEGEAGDDAVGDEAGPVGPGELAPGEFGDLADVLESQVFNLWMVFGPSFRGGFEAFADPVAEVTVEVRVVNDLFPLLDIVDYRMAQFFENRSLGAPDTDKHPRVGLRDARFNVCTGQMNVRTGRGDSAADMSLVGRLVV